MFSTATMGILAKPSNISAVPTLVLDHLIISGSGVGLNIDAVEPNNGVPFIKFVDLGLDPSISDMYWHTCSFKDGKVFAVSTTAGDTVFEIDVSGTKTRNTSFAFPLSNGTASAVVDLNVHATNIIALGAANNNGKLELRIASRSNLDSDPWTYQMVSSTTDYLNNIEQTYSYATNGTVQVIVGTDALFTNSGGGWIMATPPWAGLMGITGNFVNMTGIAWSPSLNKFVACGYTSDLTATMMASSVDGINWTLIQYSSGRTFAMLNNVDWCGDRFMVSSETSIIESFDGSNFTETLFTINRPIYRNCILTEGTKARYWAMGDLATFYKENDIDGWQSVSEVPYNRFLSLKRARITQYARSMG